MTGKSMRLRLQKGLLQANLSKDTRMPLETLKAQNSENQPRQR